MIFVNSLSNLFIPLLFANSNPDTTPAVANANGAGLSEAAKIIAFFASCSVDMVVVSVRTVFRTVFIVFEKLFN